MTKEYKELIKSWERLKVAIENDMTPVSKQAMIEMVEEFVEELTVIGGLIK